MKKPKAAVTGKPSTDQPEEEYKPTPREQEAIKAFVASREARKLSSRLKVTKQRPAPSISASTIKIHSLDRCALGVTDFDFAAGI